jgi:SsrA-binding protein
MITFMLYMLFLPKTSSIEHRLRPDNLKSPGGAGSARPLPQGRCLSILPLVNSKAGGEGPVIRNRKALHDYHILDRWEAGIELRGSEVKSLREGKGNLADAYAKIEQGQVVLVNMHISPYDPAARENHDPRRARRLLLHKQEIRRLFGKVNEKGLTLVPLSVYFKKGRVKIELGLATGKKLYDKRAAIKEKDLRRARQRGDDD